MKTIATILIFFCFILTESLAQKKDNFPTYEQIMPKTEDMFDYVSPKGDGTVRINRSLLSNQIYGYPKNSVIYYLNGKKTKDEEKVRKMVDANGHNITNVTTDEVKKNGTRIIRIDFENTKNKK